MARPKGYHTFLKEYLKELKNKEVSKRYIRKTELTLKKIFKLLKEGNRNRYPTRINYEDVVYIRDQIPISNKPNRSSRTQQNYIESFRIFLRFCGNHIRSPPFRSFVPDRPRIAPEEYDHIMNELDNIPDWELITGRVMVLLGSLGIRRIGQLRLRPENITKESIYVMGKGRGGGKARMIPIDDRIHSILNNYLEMRREIIQICLKKRQKQEVPDKLLIWFRKNHQVGSVHQSKFDNIFLRISEITGVRVTAHMLRRYGGTEFYILTKDSETTMKFGGWSDSRTFRDYLGLDPVLQEGVKKMMDHRENRQKNKYNVPSKDVKIGTTI